MRIGVIISGLIIGLLLTLFMFFQYYEFKKYGITTDGFSVIYTDKYIEKDGCIEFNSNDKLYKFCGNYQIFDTEKKDKNGN